MDNYQLKDIDQVAFNLGTIDAKGNQTDGSDIASATFSVSDSTLGSIALDDGGLSGSLQAVGPLGSFQFNAIVTMKDGSTQNGSRAVNVVASATSGVAINFGAETAIPAPVAPASTGDTPASN